MFSPGWRKTHSGVSDVVSGGAKLAVAGGKALYNTAEAGIGLARAVNAMIPKNKAGSSSSSSSSGNRNDSFPFPMNKDLPKGSFEIPTGFKPPKVPKETWAQEAGRRSKAGEKADDVLDDFLRRQGGKRKSR